MDFGSTSALSCPINPAVDVEELDQTDYSAGVRSAMNKNVDMRGENVCLLDILDSAGQEEYSALRDHYTMKANAFLIVFSVTDRSSFQEAESIYLFCCNYRGSKTVPAVFCANKSDLGYNRQVSDIEVQALGKRLNRPVFHTSAKQRINIDEAFIKLVQITPRSGVDYQIAVLGAGAVGKSSITIQFIQNQFVEHYDPTIEDSYRKQIYVPDLPPVSQSIPSKATTTTTNTVSKVVRRSSGFFSSFFRSGSRSSQGPSTPLPTYTEATAATTTITSSGTIRKVRRIPKKDTNIVVLNLGTLAPENFDMLEVHSLDLSPPACLSCSAVLRSESSCAFCGAENHGVRREALEYRRPTEEYTLLKGLDFSSSPDEATSNLDKKGLVIFCVDVSGSMALTQQVQQLQGMWQNFKQQQQNQPTTSGGASTSQTPSVRHVSRLECMQDAIQVHLDRLEQQFPERSVAIIDFAGEINCFYGGSRSTTRTFHPTNFKRIEDGMDAQTLTTNPAIVRGNIEAFRKRVKQLVTRGSTALGSALAVSLGLARTHKHKTGAGTEIFLCTDGEANTGMGSINASSQGVLLNGREFYTRAGEIAVDHSAKINIIGIEGESLALDTLAVAAQISGGIVTTVKPDELRREIRTASQRRVLAKNVTVKLHAAVGWRFPHDARPGTTVAGNTLSHKLAQVDDETTVAFAFSAAHVGAVSADKPTHFQAQITYTLPSTGETKVRVIHQVISVTSDRENAETGVKVALVGTYALQRISFMANKLLIQNTAFNAEGLKQQLRGLRDELYATHQLLIRGAKTNTQQEELGNFAHESAQLDQHLEEMLNQRMIGATRDQAAKSFVRMGALSGNALYSGSKRVGQVKRRAVFSSLS